MMILVEDLKGTIAPQGFGTAHLATISCATSWTFVFSHNFNSPTASTSRTQGATAASRWVGRTAGIAPVDEPSPNDQDLNVPTMSKELTWLISPRLALRRKVGNKTHDWLRRRALCRLFCVDSCYPRTIAGCDHVADVANGQIGSA